MDSDGTVEGLVWSVGSRRFRSWIRSEAEAYAFLIMWTPLDWREETALEMFDGLDEVSGNMPLSCAEIGAALSVSEERARDLVRSARAKVRRQYQAHGVPIRRERAGTASEALDRLQAAARAARGD